jgi:hypothetical protein
MKKTVFYFLLVAIIVSSCKNQEKTVDQSETTKEEKTEVFKTIEGGEVCYTIGDQYAGEFIIGNDIPKQEDLDHFTISKKEIKKMEEGTEIIEEYYEISKDDKEVLTLKPQIQRINGKTFELIQEIEVISDKYKTSFGITVGSDIEAFMSAYPDFKIWYSYVGDIYVVESEQIQAQFLLSADDFKGKIENPSDVVFLKADDFNGGAKIQKIRIL